MRPLLSSLSVWIVLTSSCFAQDAVLNFDWQQPRVASPLTTFGKVKIYTAPLTNPDYLKSIEVYNTFRVNPVSDTQAKALSKFLAEGKLGIAFDSDTAANQPSNKQYTIVSCMNYKVKQPPTITMIPNMFPELDKYRPALDVVCGQATHGPHDMANAVQLLSSTGMIVQPSWIPPSAEAKKIADLFTPHGQLITKAQ